MRLFHWLFRKPEPAVTTQDYHIFVSYSRNDSEIVTPLVQMLRLSGTGIFRDTDHIRPGTRWRTVLIEAVENCQLLLLFWCHHAATSAEVKREYTQALQQGKLLSPVLLDDTPLTAEMAEFQAIDMRGLFHHVAPPLPPSESTSGGMSVGKCYCPSDDPPDKATSRESIQKRLGRVRAPRVEIDYECLSVPMKASSDENPLPRIAMERLMSGLEHQLAKIEARHSAS
ncbi:MAG: toll/interleukin-1 receptor domain-containing protein [Planctomycetia bacterium]|nr:toll/interleukin-1 receptor domain-containing protein [Planctomycetia bacterium]